jgi:ABC-type multidrug transport system fused ATPase/permease subunit
LQQLGDKPTDQYELMNTRNSQWYTRLCDYARDPIDALTKVYTCLRFVDSPSSVPFSLANLELINTTISSLTYSLSSLGSQVEGISAQIDKVRRFYELLEIPNQIEDGHIPFPENQMDLSQGISVEFKNVSFVYSDSDSDEPEFALKNTSFKIEQGQLCVCFLNSCYVLFC